MCQHIPMDWLVFSCLPVNLYLLIVNRVSFKGGWGEHWPLLGKFFESEYFKSKKLVTLCTINANNSLKYAYIHSSYATILLHSFCIAYFQLM